MYGARSEVRRDFANLNLARSIRRRNEALSKLSTGLRTTGRQFQPNGSLGDVRACAVFECRSVNLKVR
jgi:hypothetical protein